MEYPPGFEGILHVANTDRGPLAPLLLMVGEGTGAEIYKCWRRAAEPVPTEVLDAAETKRD